MAVIFQSNKGEQSAWLLGFTVIKLAKKIEIFQRGKFGVEIGKFESDSDGLIVLCVEIFRLLTHYLHITLIIFKDSDKQVLYRKKVKTPYHDFSKFQTLGLGTFIWKIQAMKSGKEIGEESNSRFKFQIATKLRRLKSEDIKITSPEKIYLD